MIRKALAEVHGSMTRAAGGLDRLAGKEKSETLMKLAQPELASVYTLKLGALLKSIKENTEAEFYVVLVPGPAGTAEVAEVNSSAATRNCDLKPKC